MQFYHFAHRDALSFLLSFWAAEVHFKVATAEKIVIKHLIKSDGAVT